MSAKIYLNCELLGSCEDPVAFTNEMREKRRKGEVSHEMNITYYEDNNEIFIYTDPGRARRPLIIVKNGIPCLNEEHINKIADGKLFWDDLINNGIIEYLDAEEEENSYIAVSLNDLTNEHTHLEIDPATMLGICAGIIPFADHNPSPRNTMAAGMAKQALGFPVSNFALRTDDKAHLLHHPQVPIVKTRIIDSSNYDLRPAGQNFVVALMPYEGYNMEDAMVFNKASLERGLARSSFFRAYDTTERWYPGGHEDRFEVPKRRVKGYRPEKAYRHLGDDGVIEPESYVESGDVLIGKTSPPRFLEEIDEFGIFEEKRRETSVTVKPGEKGIVDAVLLTETVEGSRLAKIRLRDTRQPEYGDKFASRHGQKGVIGLIEPPENLPFTEFGVVPDVIVNPHAIPSRMTVAYTLEEIAGKAGCLEGERVDATPFNKELQCEIRQQLFNHGFESAGCESLYNGVTGERVDAEIFIGVMYYQKLNRMTTDKVFARSRGPVQVLTRQPTEGRELEGGVRFGEMERDCLVAHGAALTLKERLLDESDKYEAIVCENCGMLAVYDINKNKKYCPICGDVETYPVEISYAFKLLLDELKSLCIFPKLVLGDKTEHKKSFKKKSSFKVKPAEENSNVISKVRLDDEQIVDADAQNNDVSNCIVCGKKLNKTQKNLCRNCSRKQYASKIVKKLVEVVKPEVTFKKEDLKSLNLADLQIKDYIWTLQEFNLIDVDKNNLKLKDADTLNDFRIKSKMEPIDFDGIFREDELYKTCATCGKTLPISEFYKIAVGYEDNCKNCKKLIIAANYLNEIITDIGFGKEFQADDLKEHISNQNQILGAIWLLQENDLLIETDNDSYILADDTKCLNFLDKYYSGNKSDSKSSRSKSTKSKSTKSKSTKPKSVKSKSTKSKSTKLKSVKSKSTKSKSTKPRSSKSKSTKTTTDEIKDKPIKINNKQEQMKIILDARENGKTREESAKLADIPLYKLIHWYKEGEQGFGKDNIKFYKQLKRIENKLLNSSDSNERKQMEFVLKLFRQGKSKSQVSKITELNVSTFTSWFNQGKNKHNENTIYFYKEYCKIKKEESKKEKPTPKSNKVSKTKPNKEDKNKTSSLDRAERKKMDVVLNALRDGKSRHDAAKEAEIPITQISNWDMNGRLGYSKNTVYFRNELIKIDKNEFNKEKTILKSKEVPKSKSKKSDKNKINNSHDDERKKMDIVLNTLRDGKSRHDAAKEAEISITKISSWEMNGHLGYSDNTVYFIEELDKIQSSDEINNKSKAKSIKPANSKDNLNYNNFKSNNIKNSGLNNIKNKSNIKKDKSDKDSNKFKSSNIQSSKKNNLDLKDEKQVMDAVLSLISKGYSRVKAAQEVGIKVSQILIWYAQGRENHSENTAYFFNKLNIIEKKK